MGVQIIRNMLGAILLAGFIAHAQAAHTQAQLILPVETARAGDTVLAGVDLKMDADWHTYWRNPGDSGSPTKIEWQLPPGVTAGEIQWPLPHKLIESDLTTYVYTNEAVLLVPLTLASNLAVGQLELKAKVSWLECKELCLPGEQEISATLAIGEETKPSTDAAILETWQSKIPQTNLNVSASAQWRGAATNDTRGLDIMVNALGTHSVFSDGDFFPDASDHYEIAVKNGSASNKAGVFWLFATVKKLDGDWPKEIPGLLVVESDTVRQGIEVKLPVGETAASDRRLGVAPVSNISQQGKINVETATTAVLHPQPLWLMLAFAFIGGLILNIMPCVFPVIALKILGFVQHGRSEPRQVFHLGLIYGLGVVVSFLVLAGMVIGVQRAGGAASWGMQLQNPQFSLALTALVTLVALNLFGVFEIVLNGRALGAAGALASKPGAAGAFFNGVLATALATPCTAPFLAPALGYAFAQPPAVIMLFFTTIALGLGAPYVVLSWQPAWLKFLPRPGAWMEKFKIAMGFPMLATAVWLFSFTAKRFGTDGPLWVGLFLIVMALAAWVWGEFVQRGSQRKTLAAIISLALLAAGYGYALENQLHWRTPAGTTTNTVNSTVAENGIVWQKWSAEAVAQARAAGRPVLVDFTADWCLTCQVNKRSSLEIPEVGAKLRTINAATLIADNTDSNPAIVAELKKFDRAGVPLVLVYPVDASQPPLVLPALLTPGIVLDALNKAAPAVSKP